MFGWFRRAKSPPDWAGALVELQESHNQVVKALNELRKTHAQLQDDHDALHAAFVSFRGRVYAWRGKIELAPSEEPQQLDLNDPKLSKAEVKARLGLSTPAGAAAYMRGKTRSQ